MYGRQFVRSNFPHALREAHDAHVYTYSYIYSSGGIFVRGHIANVAGFPSYTMLMVGIMLLFGVLYAVGHNFEG